METEYTCNKCGFKHVGNLSDFSIMVDNEKKGAIMTKLSDEDLIYVKTTYNRNGDARIQLIRRNFPEYCWKTAIVRRKPLFGILKSRPFEERLNTRTNEFVALRLKWLAKDEASFKKRVEGDGWE